MKYRVCVGIKYCMIKKILIEDPEHILHVPWSILIPLSMLLHGKAQFISQIVKMAHKFRNYLLIIFIYHFTTLLAFELFWPFYIWSSIRRGSNMTMQAMHGRCHCYQKFVLMFHKTLMQKRGSLLSELLRPTLSIS